MEEIGKIVSVTGRLAKVEVEPKEGCSRCAMARICSPQGRKRYIEAVNQKGAGDGAMVKLQINPRTEVKASVLVFAFPIIAFVAGFAGFSLIFKSQGIGILGGFVFLAVYLLVLSRIDKGYRPVVIDYA